MIKKFQLQLKSILKHVWVTVFFLSIFGTNASAAPRLDEIGIKVGSNHKVILGLGAVMVKVIKVGSEGWIAVEITENASSIGMKQGLKMWINLNTTTAVSAPFN